MRAWLALLPFALALGCGSAPPAPAAPPELRTLGESRALEIVSEVLSDEGVALGPAWTVRIARDTEIEIDARLARTNFGIEWVSLQDRTDLGDALPRPADNGQLRILPGIESDASVQVLVLEASAYSYTNEREHVQRGVPGAAEAEGRLRRDVRDFLEYVRGQGGL